MEDLFEEEEDRRIEEIERNKMWVVFVHLLFTTLIFKFKMNLLNVNFVTKSRFYWVLSQLLCLVIFRQYERQLQIERDPARRRWLLETMLREAAEKIELSRQVDQRRQEYVANMSRFLESAGLKLRDKDGA